MKRRGAALLAVVAALLAGARAEAWVPLPIRPVQRVLNDSGPDRNFAFHDAEGFGVETPAGSMGDTLRVTTLRDGGPGSLRWAVEHTGPRIIVFDVGGTIRLTSRLRVREPFLSILGQTAPTPGITIRDHDIAVNTHDVLIRHLRIRVGDRGDGDPGGLDGIKIGPLAERDGVFNVVIDHCSVSWTTDEALEVWYPGVHDVTVSHCIFAEGLNNSRHPDGPHAFGPMIGPTAKRVAFIHNLIAHFTARTPDVQGGSHSLIVNNVIYDPLWIFIGIHNRSRVPEPLAATIIGNVCVRGPSARGRLNKAVYLYDTAPETLLYVRDNWCVDSSSEPATSIELSDANTGRQLASVRLVTTPPVMCDRLTIRSSADAYWYVLATAGARPWDRDATDRRVIDQVVSGTGRIIDSQEDVGGW